MHSLVSLLQQPVFRCLHTTAPVLCTTSPSTQSPSFGPAQHQRLPVTYLNCGVPLQTNDEDEKKMAEKHVVDGVKRVVEKLLARRKLKRSYEYEVQWQGQPPTSEYTTWFPRDK